MALGRLDLVSPVRGEWPFRQYGGSMCFPDQISVGERKFRKAVLQEQKPGVVEQYREFVAENSFHLYVMGDGSWTIAHRDDVNPDIGGVPAAVKHFVVDHPLGQALAVAGVCLIVGAIVVALAKGGGGLA